jgi:hypothetical protein
MLVVKQLGYLGRSRAFADGVAQVREAHLLLMFVGNRLQGLGETTLRAVGQGLLKEMNDRDVALAQEDAKSAHSDREMVSLKDRKLGRSDARIGQHAREIAVLNAGSPAPAASSSMQCRRACWTSPSRRTSRPAKWHLSSSGVQQHPTPNHDNRYAYLKDGLRCSPPYKIRLAAELQAPWRQLTSSDDRPELSLGRARLALTYAPHERSVAASMPEPFFKIITAW